MVRRMFYIKAIRISRLKGVENLQKVKARVSSEREKCSAERFIHPVRYQMIQRGGIADSVHQIPEPMSLSTLHPLFTGNCHFLSSFFPRSSWETPETRNRGCSQLTGLGPGETVEIFLGFFVQNVFFPVSVSRQHHPPCFPETNFDPEPTQPEETDPAQCSVRTRGIVCAQWFSIEGENKVFPPIFLLILRPSHFALRLKENRRYQAFILSLQQFPIATYDE